MYDVTNPLSPLLELTPASPLMCLQYRYLHYTITIYNIYNIYCTAAARPTCWQAAPWPAASCWWTPGLEAGICSVSRNILAYLPLPRLPRAELQCAGQHGRPRDGGCVAGHQVRLGGARQRGLRQGRQVGSARLHAAATLALTAGGTRAPAASWRPTWTLTRSAARGSRDTAPPASATTPACLTGHTSTV